MLHHEALLRQAVAKPDPIRKIFAIDVWHLLDNLCHVLYIEEKRLDEHKDELKGDAAIVVAGTATGATKVLVTNKCNRDADACEF